MELYSKLHMRAIVVDLNCSSLFIFLVDPTVPSVKAAIISGDV